MWRLSPPHFSRLEEAVSLDVRIGGSESNTAVALSRLGLRVAWSSKLPANPLGRRISTEIQRWGVDTSTVIWDTAPNARAGNYFLDFGVAPRSTHVYYDRANSSACSLRSEELSQEWLTDTRLLHLTGITPALSESCAEAVRVAFALAKQAGVLRSFDVNYRSKLWTASQAEQTLEPLMQGIDLLMCPQADAETIFGITGDEEEVAQRLRDRFEVGSVIVTLGGGGAYASDAHGTYRSSPYPLGHIVDRVGAGDAFNAGVLMGYLQGDIDLGMRYGTAMAALKHTMPGDLLLSSREEIEEVLGGSRGGIRR